VAEPGIARHGRAKQGKHFDERKAEEITGRGTAGLSDIMFDRFYDHSKGAASYPPEKKIYLSQKSELVLPAENIISFLVRDEKPTGVIRQKEGNKAMQFLAPAKAYVNVDPLLIPFLGKDGKPIIINGELEKDKRFYINDWSSGLTKQTGGKVIKQESRARPVLRLPWFLSFLITVIKNEKVTQAKLLEWFEYGGHLQALGTYRPKHGRFLVQDWNVRNGKG
jgi:hypothetical protein